MYQKVIHIYYILVYEYEYEVFTTLVGIEIYN